MEQIFCKDKKDFCDGVEDCAKCQYAKGNGVIYGYVAHDLLCSLFGGDYDLDRLRELVEADKAGRSIVAPAQIGDSVWHITTCKDFPKVLDGTMYGAKGECGTATGYYCPCELAENCPFLLEEDDSFDCDKHKNTLAIYEDVVTEIIVNDMGSFVRLDYSGCVDFEDFGKTVFLTREEAEAALEKMKEAQA